MLVTALAPAASAAAVEPTWLPAVRVSADTTDMQYPDPVVAAPDGTVLAGVRRDTLFNGVVGVATRPPGGSFGQVRALSDPAGGDATGLRLAVDEQGTAVAVWYEDQLGTPVIRASVRPAGGDFSAPQTISTGGAPDFPAVAIAGDTAVATWPEDDGTGTQLMTAVKPKGSSTFSAASPLGPADSSSPPAVDVAVAADGSSLVLWRAPSDDVLALMAAVRPAGGAFAPLPPLFTTAAPDDGIVGARVVMTPDGGATAAWSVDAGETAMYGASRGPGEAFGAPQALSAPGAAVVAGAFDLAGGPNSSAVVVWRQGGEIKAATRRSGASFGAPETVEPTGATGAPAVATTPTGRAVVAWVGTSNGEQAVQTASRPPGGAFGPIADVEVGVGTGDSQVHIVGEVHLAADGQGDAVATWGRLQDIDPGPSVSERASIRGSGYDGAPPAITSASFPADVHAGGRAFFGAHAVDVWSPVTYSWAFGDGTSSGETRRSAMHAYAEPGSYGVTVTVTDALGNAASTSGTVNVLPSTPRLPLVPPPPPRPPAPRVLGSRVSLSVAKLRRGRRRVVRLVVTGIAKGDTVKLSCTGKGCTAKARRTINATRTKLDLSRSLRKLALAPRAKLTISVTRALWVGKAFRYTMRRAGNPRRSIVCLAPGTAKPAACPAA